MQVSAPPGSTVSSVRSQLKQMPPGESRIAEVMVGLGGDLIYRTVSDIAAEAGTSISSVVRCCQRLGFKGFQDCKIALARDGDAPVQTVKDGIAASDSPATIREKVVAAAAEAVTVGAGFVDGDHFARAVQLLRAAPRVLFIGVGTSAPLAQDAAYRMLTIGVPAEAPADVHVQHVRAGLLRPGDLVVAVSHTGSTQETVTALEAAKAAGADAIAVTSFARSPIVTLADVVLVAGSSETSYRVEAMASRIAHIVVLDALFVATAHSDEPRANRALEVMESALAEHRY